jgi:hypothetical protein
MKTLFVATAAFAALVLIAPVGKAQAQVPLSHTHPDGYFTSLGYLNSDRPRAKGPTVSKATVALMGAWLTMSDQCDKAPAGVGDKYPASCTAMQPISETLAKQGCEMMGNDQKPEAYWTCGGKTWEALR